MRMSPSLIGALALAVALAASRPARADDYFGAHPADTVTVRQANHRTTGQRALIGGLLGGALVAAGTGLYFHLQSRDASNEVSVVGDFTSLTWTPQRQDTYDRALGDRTLAIVGYSVGGALLVGSAVALILTNPGSKAVEVGPSKAPPPTVPVSFRLLPGGAYAEAGWRW